MTTQELLERLQLLDETERIGAKAGSDAGKSVMETVCAFANEPGMGEADLSPSRKAESARQDYLRPPLRAGRIAMTRPDKPNDPDQAYHA